MTQKITVVCLGLLLKSFMTQGAVEIPAPSAVVPECVQEKSPGTDLGTVSALITFLQSRGLLTETDRDIEDFLIDSLLQKTQAERFCPSDKIKTTEQERVAGEPELLSSATLYLRIYAVNRGFFHYLKELKKTEKYSRAKTIIFDLRDVAGTAVPGDFAEFQSIEGKDEKPCAVLVNSGTSLGAELLAGQLSSRRNTVLIGQPTRGNPYPEEKVTITETLSLSIPQKPALNANFTWPPSPLQPDIIIQSPEYTGVETGEKLLPVSENIKADPVLLRALDLMSMAVALDPRPENTGSRNE